MTTTKFCTGCNRTLPRDEEHFPVDYRNQDGTVRRWKSRCKECGRAAARGQRQRHRLRIANSPDPVDHERDVWLDVAPFRDWLRRLVAFYGKAGTAERIDTSERILHRWLHESQMVHIDHVDRALLRDGNTDLWELYGETSATRRYHDEAA